MLVGGVGEVRRQVSGWLGAGISDEDKRVHVWDFDNSLATELQAQDRSGDPNEEGIAWHRVAEISLLGALGCGSTLLRLVLEELERGDQYDYVVLQATDNAISFYESEGFIRVGTIARPDQEAVALKAMEAQARAEARAKEAEDKRARQAEERQRERAQKEQVLLADVRRRERAWAGPAAAVVAALIAEPAARALQEVRPDCEQVFQRLRASLDDRRAHAHASGEGASTVEVAGQAFRLTEAGEVVRCVHAILRPPVWLSGAWGVAISLDARPGFA